MNLILCLDTNIWKNYNQRNSDTDWSKSLTIKKAYSKAYSCIFQKIQKGISSVFSCKPINKCFGKKNKDLAILHKVYTIFNTIYT